jgi:hypothetical protein
MVLSSRSSDLHPNTRRWWGLLRGVSALNIALLLCTWLWVRPTDTAGWVSLVAAGLFVGVCAFRSAFPRVDLERTVMVDHWLSSIVLGRTAATVAEMAFMVQCALYVERLGTHSGMAWLHGIAVAAVVVIAVAQVCCWLGVLTLNHLWHAAEEALWAVTMVMLGVAFVASWGAVTGIDRVLIPIGLVGVVAGGWVMAGLDIPMYLRRWRAETASGTRFLGVSEGFVDALHRRERTGSWAVWQHEVAWMTPYFSAAVWVSLVLAWL